MMDQSGVQAPVFGILCDALAVLAGGVTRRPRPAALLRSGAPRV